ncbi:TetR/AcrR family transcriptional regulator [Saccharothrix obliqua]|uniref:TetR/AcrR family transcriptional regulator n=1 Tax=Saccharothrix obliqua TaxID=2861747 RepID=UPI001C60139C|nr:TetR family transcriptional regulator C-terminal domain-containing protein [Saccharothrix obliqua]MBW4719927.1 TetR family transcriptional regulator C-terminal domain-containing protein [Saccharothrix obliqua]
MPKLVDADARRRAVAEAVFRVVRAQGLEQASLRNVAEAADLAIGSVRHYFTNHDELLTFALDELIARVERRLMARVNQVYAATAAADRRAAVEDLLGELLPLDPDRHDEAVVWLEFTNAARTRPALAPAARRLHEGIRAIARRVLEGVGAAEVAVEAERLAALLDGLAVDAVLQPDLITPDVMRAVLGRHLDTLPRAVH